MAKDVKFVISASVARAEEEIRKLQSTGTATADRLTNSFQQLGIRSTMAIEQQRASAVAAYEKIKSSGVASADEILRAKTALTSKMRELDSETKNASGSALGLKDAYLGLQSAFAAAGIVAFSGKLVEARVELDKINNSMKATFGAGAAAELAYVRQEAERLGLSIQPTAESFGKFAAAAKGTKIEGEGVRNVFSSVTAASTVLGLSADETKGILNALGQMLSKGKVQAEELRGQLGERLPGAFKMAADAMGVTQAELDGMLRKGEVLATDLLPKLALEMDKRFGSQIPEAAKKTGAEMQRMQTAFFDLKTEFSDGSAFAAFFRSVTGSTEFLKENLDAAAAGMVALTASSMIAGLGSLATALKGVGAAATIAKAGIYGVAAASGYYLGKKLDEAVYEKFDVDISGMNRPQEEMAIAQTSLDKNNQTISSRLSSMGYSSWEEYESAQKNGYYLDGSRASGGPVQAGKQYLVGEEGPEIIRMGNTGGTVVPNSQLGTSVSLGGISITIQGDNVSEATGVEIGRKIWTTVEELSQTRKRA